MYKTLLYWIFVFCIVHYSEIACEADVAINLNQVKSDIIQSSDLCAGNAFKIDAYLIR